MYAWLDEKNASERKPGMTDEAVLLQNSKERHRSFQETNWEMPAKTKKEIGQAWEAQFSRLFRSLGVTGTRIYVDSTINL